MTSFSNESQPIQGLTYTPDYITTEQEQLLISKIDAQSWLADLKRRVQHYGYKYDYKACRITPHIDCNPCFGDTICSLSLLEPCEMILEKNNIKHSIILEPRSLLMLQGEARYKWKHSIPQRKSNIKNRRVSITYRKVIV